MKNKLPESPLEGQPFPALEVIGIAVGLVVFLVFLVMFLGGTK